MYTFLRYGFIFLILFTSQLHAERFDHDDSDTRPPVCWKKESEGPQKGDVCKLHKFKQHLLGVVKRIDGQPVCHRVFDNADIKTTKFEFLHGMTYDGVHNYFQSVSEPRFISKYPACNAEAWDRPLLTKGVGDTDSSDHHKVCLTLDEHDGHQIGIQDSAAVCHSLGGKTYRYVAESEPPVVCSKKCQWVPKGCAWAWQKGTGASNYGHHQMDACQKLAIRLGYDFASNDGISCGAGDYLNYNDCARGSNFATEHVCKEVCTRQ